MKLFLTGYMGVGKTTVGKELSELLKQPFIDLDHEIEALEGKKVKDIFNDQGEDYFRELEAKTLRDVTRNHNSFILATGGGTPCYHQNMEWMLESGKVVWLMASVQTILDRIEDTGSRPLLTGKSSTDIRKFIHQQLRYRRPFYRKAHHAVRANGSSKSIAIRVIKVSHSRFLRNVLKK